MSTTPVTGKGHCDIIVQRWEQFTGQKAERIAAAEEVTRAQG